MLDSAALVLIGLAGVALGSQPQAPDPIPAPLRELTWGQLNFLHTTDVHGWYSGHLQEPSFSADWGDYISFTTRMREKAEAAGTDLLVVDTGDRVEGNGLYDSSDPKGVYASEFLKKQHIDLLCSGNHELYKQNTSEAEFRTTVPNFKGNYLASNIDIIDPESGEIVPLAQRFKKFTTKMQGIRIMAFGFLFDFKGNYNNAVVTPVEETIRQASSCLASGRFMETIGFASLSGLSTAKKQTSAARASPVFTRRYIDNNLFSLYYHSGHDESTFHTPEGKKVTEDIRKARSVLKLDHVYGCAPKTLWMSRAKYPSDDSIYSWLEKEVLPSSLRPHLRENTTGLAIINTGGIRFDIFKGPFTQDGAYIVSPFTNEFRYMKDVPYDKAVMVLKVLNKATNILTQAGFMPRDSSSLSPPEQWSRTEDFIAKAVHIPLSQGADNEQNPLQDGDEPTLTPGYTTKDDGGTDGDDTVHTPVSFYRAPNCIMATITNDDDSSSTSNVVDLLYLDFLEPWVTVATKIVGIDFDPKKDAEAFMPGVQMRTMLTAWASQHWSCPSS
ncbi:uncharacterized protein TERG_08521 [Trichophyton rubrum CBS 118892]|uniref:Uncharacterized protein n=1 Tax=Trichophyton rubrum (strain ATCC MYA-4607 / CBS 118892) TaxID=559305 RepID=F2T134_TRIRC|nr:uncharacterized protein TERG_08521 [Trichophyton rubrum CBS 118892]EGD92306.1 hypothetical protein TERG_08521 [Trichophyton rubrum CBS 118892]